MQYYNHNLDLPYSKLNIKFRELTTNEQLLLSKTNLILEYNPSGFYEYFDFLNDIIRNCVKDYNDILNLDVIEFVLLVTKIRSISIGNSIEFHLENKNESDIKNQKITINLNYFIKNLYDTSNTFFENKNNQIIDKNIIIKLKYPSIKNIDIFLNTKTYENFNETLVEFIDEIQVNNSKIKFSAFEYKQKQDFIDKLSINIKKKIEEKIILILNKLLNTNFLGLDYFKDQKFTFYGLGFMSFLKIFFSYDIKSLYIEIYHLATNGLSSDYILNISPSERKLYISIINEINKSKSESSNDSSSGWSNIIKNHTENNSFNVDLTTNE
jgi:hypothetical protein